MAGIGSEAAGDGTVKTDLGAGDQGNPNTVNGTGANGSGAGASATPSPETENLEFAKAKGWLGDDGTYKVPDVLKSYQSLEKELGSRVKVPDDKSTPEERDAFAKRLGYTGDVKDYTFAPPADLPKDLPYNADLAKGFSEWAVAERLTPAVAKSLHDRFVGFQAKAFQDDVAAMAADTEKKSKDAHQIVVKEWGGEGSAGYSENIEAARRAFNDPKLAGFKEHLIATGQLTPKGEFTSFYLAHILANHGKAFVNDTVINPTSYGNAGEANPFAKTLADGKTPNPAFNLTEAGQLVNQNPDKARRLIQQAGRDPKDFGLSTA